MLSLGGRILFLDEEFPILPLLPFPTLPLRIIEEAGCIGSLSQSHLDKMTGKKKRRQINNNKRMNRKKEKIMLKVIWRYNKKIYPMRCYYR